jgi:hypothetical protein
MEQRIATRRAEALGPVDAKGCASYAPSMQATTSDLSALLDPLLDALADKIVSKLTAGALPGFVDQVQSPLGRRRHVAACRARIARGEPGAAIVGRRHLMSQEALAAELRSAGSRRSKDVAPRSVADELRAQLGLPRPGGRS